MDEELTSVGDTDERSHFVEYNHNGDEGNKHEFPKNLESLRNTIQKFGTGKKT